MHSNLQMLSEMHWVQTMSDFKGSLLACFSISFMRTGLAAMWSLSFDFPDSLSNWFLAKTLMCVEAALHCILELAYVHTPDIDNILHGENEKLKELLKNRIDHMTKMSDDDLSAAREERQLILCGKECLMNLPLFVRKDLLFSLEEMHQHHHPNIVLLLPPNQFKNLILVIRRKRSHCYLDHDIPVDSELGLGMHPSLN